MEPCPTCRKLADALATLADATRTTQDYRECSQDSPELVDALSNAAQALDDYIIESRPTTRSPYEALSNLTHK